MFLFCRRLIAFTTFSPNILKRYFYHCQISVKIAQHVQQQLTLTCHLQTAFFTMKNVLTDFYIAVFIVAVYQWGESGAVAVQYNRHSILACQNQDRPRHQQGNEIPALQGNLSPGPNVQGKCSIMQAWCIKHHGTIAPWLKHICYWYNDTYYQNDVLSKFYRVFST